MFAGSSETVRSVLIKEGDDHDGDPVLFATVIFTSREALKNTRTLLDYKLQARDLLEELEEFRFPIFTFVLATEYDKYAAA